MLERNGIFNSNLYCTQGPLAFGHLSVQLLRTAWSQVPATTSWVTVLWGSVRCLWPVQVAMHTAIHVTVFLGVSLPLSALCLPGTPRKVRTLRMKWTSFWAGPSMPGALTDCGLSTFASSS